MSAPRAVIFDLDDTLMPELDAIRAAFASACDIAFPGSPTQAALLRRGIQRHARALWRTTPHVAYCRRIGFSSWEGLWGDASGSALHHRFFGAWQPSYRSEAWRRALRDAGNVDTDLAERVSDAFRAEARARLRPFDGAVDVVRELRRDHAVGLLTNGESGIQREKMTSAGFEGMFAAVVVSGDIGVGKPSQEPFRLVLARMGGRPTDAVMVGNSARSDILGAQAVGMRAVLVGVAPSAPVGVRPDAIASTIRDVPAAIRELA